MPIAALDDQESVSAAWLEAVRFLSKQRGRHCYNLAYAITKPQLQTLNDTTVIAAFDAFARAAGKYGVTTVANTIFPLSSYRTGGAAGVFEHYPEVIYPRVKTQWGNYFERMIRRRDVKGNLLLDKAGNPVNPLESLIAKLKRRVETAEGSKTHFELPVSDEIFEISTYDPVRDGNYRWGGPCLSHLSFKLDEAGALRLTAFYRSHYYLQRALGNLVGLARLQNFVAREAGCDHGTLTLIASEACLESSLGSEKAADVKKFLAGLGV